MARSVDEVNSSIANANGVISSQTEMLEVYQREIEKNNDEYSALQKQKEILNTTYDEIDTMCTELLANCDMVEETYGGINQFAAEYTALARQKIESKKMLHPQKFLI